MYLDISGKMYLEWIIQKIISAYCNMQTIHPLKVYDNYIIFLKINEYKLHWVREGDQHGSLDLVLLKNKT